jgi:hypothetical protein
MANNGSEIFVSILSPIIILLLIWFKTKWMSKFDSYRICKWLKSHTNNESGPTHVDTMEIAKGIGLSEDRVRKACMSCKKIYRYSNGKEQWSIWCEQPKSECDGMTIEEQLKRMIGH